MLPYAVVILCGDPSLFPDVRQRAFVPQLTGTCPLKEQAHPLLAIHDPHSLSGAAETYKKHYNPMLQRRLGPALM